MSENPQASELSQLSRRATAAVIDMAIVGLLCFGMQWSIRLAEPPRHRSAVACGGLLAALVVVEMLTGWTIGKSTAGLSVKRAGPFRAALPWLILRAIVRELPVAVFLPSLWVQDGMLSLLIWGISLTLVCCYVATAYLTLVRIGKTPFDLAAGTAVLQKMGSS